MMPSSPLLPSNPFSDNNVNWSKGHKAKAATMKYYSICKSLNPDNFLDPFFIKKGNKQFGAVENRENFIARCLHEYGRTGHLPGLYELVHGKMHRLYLDIEKEYEEQPSKQVMAEVLELSVRCVQQKLVELNNGHDDARFSNVVVTTNHRWKTRDVDKRQMWTLSAHVTFPQVMFEHNNIGMKRFIKEAVQTELKKHGSLGWIALRSKGAEHRTTVDNCAYLFEQAFRVPLTSKTDDAKRLLLPYDMKTKQSFKPTDADQLRHILEGSLISKANPEGCVVFLDEQVAAFVGIPPASPAPSATVNFDFLSSSSLEDPLIRAESDLEMEVDSDGDIPP